MGAMEDGLRRFELPAAHSLPNRASMSQLPNEATPSVSIDAATPSVSIDAAASVVDAHGAMERYETKGAMEECLRRFKSPVASHSAKQGKPKSATKQGNFNGAMEEISGKELLLHYQLDCC